MRPLELSWFGTAPYDRFAARPPQWHGHVVTNPTARKFGYPGALVAETQHWLVLVRPQQPTFGSLVLVCKEAAQAFSDLSAAAFTDLKTAVDGVEALLRHTVAYERINYLMLMMVDPDVHFHVVPRYQGGREHGGRRFDDAGWPGPPALASHVALSEEEAKALAAEFAARWRS
jgi:diadenosine tetraphosphate (Ap4A) HIT family hydrolase